MMRVEKMRPKSLLARAERVFTGTVHKGRMSEDAYQQLQTALNRLNQAGRAVVLDDQGATLDAPALDVRNVLRQGGLDSYVKISYEDADGKKVFGLVPMKGYKFDISETTGVKKDGSYGVNGADVVVKKIRRRQLPSNDLERAIIPR